MELINEDFMELYGAFLQFVLFDKSSDQLLFHNDGTVKDINIFKEDLFIDKNLDNITYFKRFPDKKDLIKNKKNLSLIFEMLHSIPALFTEVGRLYIRLKNDLYQINDPKFKSIFDKDLLFNDISFYDEGGFNRIHLLKSKNKLVVLRTIKKFVLNLRNYQVQHNTHCRLREFISTDSELKELWNIPDSIFVPLHSAYMIMEFIPRSEKLVKSITKMANSDRVLTLDSCNLLLDKLKKV